MKKYINICNIYILLWCVYYLQGVLYAGGSIISQAILLVLMLISGYYFIKFNSEYATPMFIKVLNIFLILMTIYGIIRIADPTPIVGKYSTSIFNKIDFLKEIYISLLPIYSMFAFAKIGTLKIESIQALTVILVISTTFSYFQAEQDALQAAIEVGSMNEEFTNNVGYKFLHLFPLLFFWSKRPILQYVILAYISTFIIMGMKRGAIIIGAACLIWFFYRTYKSASNRNKILLISLTTIAIIIGASYIVDYYNTSEYFQYRVEQTIEGDSSGRDNLYNKLWDYFINQDSIFNILFGKGAMRTINIAGNYAHNDWFEILICQGLIGIILYIAYYISLWLFVRQNRKNVLIYNISFMCIFIMFTSSLFSMSFNSLSISIALSLGYSFANDYNSVK